MNMPSDTRLEVKFVGTPSNTTSLLRWLRSHPAGFRVAYPERRINNIYFDTFSSSALVQNVSGESQRSKVRLRWYGEAVYPSGGVLEVKRKRNAFGWKLAFPVKELPEFEGRSWREIRQEISARLPADGRIWLGEFPTANLINRYLRRYWVSADNRVRLTLDEQCVSYAQHLLNVPNVTRRVNAPDIIILECKCAREDRDVAASVLGNVPLRVSRQSKYAQSLAAVASQM